MARNPVPAPPIELARARVLISNDDGIHARGLKVLEDALAGRVGELWVVAPETEQSAASHSLTMRRPLFVRRIGERRFSVDGTPTDCVLLAVHRLMGDALPDLVLSGVNEGANLGEDATYSGTVAAAREGALLGIPSVAFSQCYADDQDVPWATAARFIAPILARITAAGWPEGVLINVNFPSVTPDAVTGIEVTRQGRHKIGGDFIERTDPRGRRYFWIGRGRDEDPSRKGTDVEAILRGAIALTPLAVDLTHAPSVAALRAVVS
jgi:5'-nucleotidase